MSTRWLKSEGWAVTNVCTYLSRFGPKADRSAPNGPTAPSTTFLKLGRSVKPVSRLSQWRSQCPSREPVVRDIFPRSDSQSVSGAGNSASLQFATRGTPHHHRWERLMLIEVAGRASLEAEQRARGSAAGGSPAVRGKVDSVCRDCGKMHQELFEVGTSAYEDWVMEIIERWMRWCELLS